ncbi:hypothetical protein [Nocardia sp. CDC160]|uniref:hypothetical protein n=1 Tax=Nocardia sp. CDC160 TaxID=3112166 RepID=UPI002DC00517|nr:hypothetical protein [Nocardia sp. CDC160]MEC3916243.1 hypothetical protein [Nocardia sp. CDC160]
MALVFFGVLNRPGAVINRLINLAYTECANEVIAPSVDHFEPGDLPALVKIADVICADTGIRYTNDNLSDQPKTITLGEGVN